MDGMTNPNTPTPETYADSGMTNTETLAPETYADTGMENTDVPAPEIYAGTEELDTAPVRETTLVPDDEFTPGAGNFVENLPYMGRGMLAIFVVIAVIMGVTALLNKVFKK